MRLKIICSAAFIIGGVLCSANLKAQQVDSAFTDIDYVRKSNTWLGSENAAGLKHFLLPQISNAQLYFNKADGKFKIYNQSDNSYTYGLNAASIYRLNNKVVFSGSIQYENFKGRNMGGSAFIDPYKNPFDLVETTDNYKGTKQLEIYQLSGGVSGQLTSKLTIGARLNYEAANYAKMKDLRHINKLLDMDASVGATYQLGKAVEVGANYIYLRRIETLGFRRFAENATTYLTLISFGSFYGRNETFSDLPFTAENGTMPLTNIGHGASVQLNINVAPHTKFYNQFSYKAKNGKYGIDGSSSYALTVHEVKQYQYTGVFALTGNSSQQQLRLNAQYENLINWENIYREVTDAGGVKRTVYFGKTEMHNRDVLTANLGYTLYTAIKNNNPAWTINADAGFSHRLLATTVYPFFRDQTIDSYQAAAGAKKNIFRGKARYTVGFEAGYGAGSSEAKFDGVLVLPSSSQGHPDNMDLYLYQEFEYFTKPRAWAGWNLQYTRVAKGSVTPYAKLSYAFTKAFNTVYLGSGFGAFGASVGCNF